MLLVYAFIGLFIYGVVKGIWGAALLSLVMAGFTIYGLRELRKRDVEFYVSQASARTEPNTLEVLQQQDSESARSTF